MSGPPRQGNASILVGPKILNHPHSVLSNRLVLRIDRDARATHVVRVTHAAHDAHDVHDYLNKTTQDRDNTTEA
jgi:hypothetical protein